MSHRQHGDTREQAEARALAIMAFWRARKRQVYAWPEPVPGAERYWMVVSTLVNGQPRDAT